MASPTQCSPSSVPGPSGLATAFLGNSLSNNPGATPHNSLNVSTIPAQPGFPVLGYQFSSTQSAPSRFGDSCSSTQQNPGGQHEAGPFGLESPAKMVNKFPGRNTSSLRELTVALACNVVFGDTVLVRSSLSGCNDSDQLDPEKLAYIKSIVRGRVGFMCDHEFELV